MSGIELSSLTDSYTTAWFLVSTGNTDSSLSLTEIWVSASKSSWLFSRIFIVSMAEVLCLEEVAGLGVEEMTRTRLDLDHPHHHHYIHSPTDLKHLLNHLIRSNREEALLSTSNASFTSQRWRAWPFVLSLLRWLAPTTFCLADLSGKNTLGSILCWPCSVSRSWGHHTAWRTVVVGLKTRLKHRQLRVITSIWTTTDISLKTRFDKTSNVCRLCYILTMKCLEIHTALIIIQCVYIFSGGPCLHIYFDLNTRNSNSH